LREAAIAWQGRVRVHEIPVDAEGVVQLEALRTVTAANNESGLLQP